MRSMDGRLYSLASRCTSSFTSLLKPVESMCPDRWLSCGMLFSVVSICARNSCSISLMSHFCSMMDCPWNRRVREHHRVEIAVLVRQLGQWVSGRHFTFSHSLVMTRQADVQSRIFFQHLDGFRIPGCYGHHFHAAGNTRAVGLDAGFVDGMQGTEIVNADDKCRGAGLSPYRQCSCCEQASGNHVFQS